ncbi:hypothetical protein ACEQPO_04355 [Bacillus sp. SL00103]
MPFIISWIKLQMGKRMWNYKMLLLSIQCVILLVLSGGVVRRLRMKKCSIDNEKRRKEMKGNTWVEGWFEKCEELKIKP